MERAWFHFSEGRDMDLWACVIILYTFESVFWTGDIDKPTVAGGKVYIGDSNIDFWMI